MGASRVEVKILDERMSRWGLPTYQSDMATGIDLHACVDHSLAIMPQAPAVLVSSGIAVHIGDPHVAGIIVPRSGLGHRGIVMGNLIGVLDADYTGPIMLSVWNRNAFDSGAIVIEPGDRVAQLPFVPIVRPVLELVDTFTRVTERGSGGFGSTGAASLSNKSRNHA